MTGQPADVFLPGWSNDHDTAFDMTVVNPLQNKYRKEAGEQMGVALVKMIKEKCMKAEDKCREAIIFQPLAFKTGTMVPQSRSG